MRDWQDALRRGSQGRSERIQNVIAPVDESETSKRALPVARLLAELYRATLHVAYTGDKPRGARQTLQELGLKAEQMRGAVLDQLQGDPAAAILEKSRQLRPSLLVMTTQVCGEQSEAALGPMTEAVLEGVPQRVVLVPAEFAAERWGLQKILLAHDGTPAADLAIAPAADLAHRAGAEVIALHVAARTAGQPEEGSLPAPRYVDQPQHEWPSWANEFLERMMAMGAAPSALNFKLLVTGGQPGSEVAQFVRDRGVDLVALAWQGRLNEQRGGTLKVVVRRAGCPVLLVGPAPARRSG